MFICGYNSSFIMHDEEPDTFQMKSPAEEYCDLLSGIGVESTPNELGSADVEKGDYFARCFTQAPRMITNRGSLEVKNSNIDAVQIIQKG